jgi:hypothetical protein
VHPVALTLEQASSLGLPSTPLKATELHADKWRARMGREQTEIDALAALRPEILREIALDALKPFFDPTLDDRIGKAKVAWENLAREMLPNVPGWEAAREDVARYRELLATAARYLRRAQTRAYKALETVKPPEIRLPEAEIVAESPEPLFTTDDDFVAASQKLIAHKALEECADGDPDGCRPMKAYYRKVLQ